MLWGREQAARLERDVRRANVQGLELLGRLRAMQQMQGERTAPATGSLKLAMEASDQLMDEGSAERATFEQAMPTVLLLLCTMTVMVG